MNKKNFVSTNDQHRSLIKQTAHFRLIRGANSLQLPKSENRSILTAGGVFVDIDVDFAQVDLNMSDQIAPPTKVSGYEIISDRRTFKKLFVSFGSLSFGAQNLEQIWLRQGHVVDICSIHAKRLHQDGRANLFLIKKDENRPAAMNNLLIVFVIATTKGPRPFLLPFSYNDVWNPQSGDRFFCRQLLAATPNW